MKEKCRRGKSVAFDLTSDLVPFCTFKNVNKLCPTHRRLISPAYCVQDQPVWVVYCLLPGWPAGPLQLVPWAARPLLVLHHRQSQATPGCRYRCCRQGRPRGRQVSLQPISQKMCSVFFYSNNWCSLTDFKFLTWHIFDSANWLSKVTYILVFYMVCDGVTSTWAYFFFFLKTIFINLFLNTVYT